MNRFYKNILHFLLVGLLVVFVGACSKDNGPTEPTENNDYSLIVSDFANKVVVAIYADLSTQAETLNSAVTLYRDSPSQENLNATCEAWKATRAPWESGEAFLFGPAAYLSLDPSMDSWPLDKAQLDEVLKSDFELTPEFIRDGLGASLRGFHTIEFLLFKDGQPRITADVTDREKEYLVAATQVLFDDASTLYGEWSSGFANEFANAGKSGSRYGSQVQAVQEIIEGIIGIADEVGNGKIYEPYSTKNVLSVESWYSWNSLNDFQNNIKSIQNAYEGNYQNGTSGTGLGGFVKEKDAALDAKVKQQITAAYTAIGEIPHPFRNNLNADIQIKAAIEACNTLASTFQTDVKALFTN